MEKEVARTSELGDVLSKVEKIFSSWDLANKIDEHGIIYKFRLIKTWKQKWHFDLGGVSITTVDSTPFTAMLMSLLPSKI